MTGKEEPSAALEEIGKKYNISPLPSLETRVNLSGGHAESLTLREVLALGWEQLLRYSLKAFEIEERKASGSLKQRVLAKKKDWLRKGVGETLAAIVLNPGLTFRWTSSGPVGDGNWQTPSPQESEYWGWAHGLSRVNVDNNLVLREIPHAVFIMRAMARDQAEVQGRPVKDSDLHAFLEQIGDLMGQEEDAEISRGLQIVNSHFSHSFDRRRS